MGIKTTVGKFMTRAGFIGKVRDEANAKTATDQERYRAKARALVDRGLNADEAAELQQLAADLGISVDEIEAHTRIIERHRQLKPVADDWEKRRDARRDVMIGIERAEADFRTAAQAHQAKVSELSNALSAAGSRMVEAAQARTAIEAMEKEHHQLLDLPAPASPAPAKVERKEAPAQTEAEVAAIGARNLARQQSFVAPSGSSLEGLEKSSRDHEALLKKATPPKPPAPSTSTAALAKSLSEVDAHAKQAGLAAAGRS
jgi:hypothetical protein